MQGHPIRTQRARPLAVYAAGLSLLAGFLASLAGWGLPAGERAPLPAIAAGQHTDLATIPRQHSVARPAAAKTPDVESSGASPVALVPAALETAGRPPRVASGARRTAAIRPPADAAHRPRGPPRA